MKNYNLNNNCFDLSVQNKIKINITSLPKAIKIVNAVLKVSTSNTSNTNFNVKYQNYKPSENEPEYWGIVDNICPTSNSIEINISDELQDATLKNLDYIELLFEGNNNINFISSNKNIIDISYLSISEFKKNGSSHNIDLSKNCSALIDLATGKLLLKSKICSSDNNVLPLAISANYSTIKNSELPSDIGLPNNWHLNLNQFLIEKTNTTDSLEFVYIDENGENQIIEEKYYYLDEDNEKTYVSRDKINVNFNGEFFFNDKVVYTELEAPSGINLVSSISDIKGADLTDYEPEELVNVKTKIEEYENACKEIKDNLLQYNKQLCFLFLQSYSFNQSDSNADNNNNNAPTYDFNNFKEKINESLNSFNHNISDSELHSIHQSFLLGNETSFKSSNLNEISLNVQIKNTIETIQKYELQKSKYEKALTKLNYQKKEYELQVPVHYLYDENLIYGFGKTLDKNGNDTNIYRLILITDMYENRINILYKSLDSNKISTIIDSQNNTINFNYKNGYLSEVIDSRNRKTLFEISSNLLTLNCNGQITKYKYSNNLLLGVLESNGFGAKFNYNNGKQVVSIEPISIINEQGISKDSTKNCDKFVPLFDSDTFNFLDYTINDKKLEFVYDNYKSTSITNAKGKKITYNFDNLGRVRTIYENNFSLENDKISSQINEFDYTNDFMSLKVSKLPNSKDYLEDVYFTGNNLTQKSALTLGDMICGNDCIPYNYSVIENFYCMPTNNSDELKKEVLVSENNINLINSLLSNNNSCNHRVLILSGWAKADSAYIPEDENLENTTNIRKFEIKAKVTYGDESVEYRKSFDWRNMNWQYCALPIMLKDKNISSIKCFIDYSNNTGSIQFTNLELKEGNFEKITYKNNLPSIKESGHTNYQTYYYYNDDKKLIKEIIKNKKTNEEYPTYYEYNKNGKLIKTEDYNHIIKENIYNDKGQVIKTLTYHKDEPANIFCQETCLDEKGNKTDELNEFGEKISKYSYIEGTGNVASISDNDKNITAYGYNNNDELIQTSVSANGEENTNIYGYTLDFLTALKHNDFEINYKYDNLGRQTEIDIAGSEYLSKAYGENIEITKLKTDEKYKQIFDKDGNVLQVLYKNKSNNLTDDFTDANKLVQNIYDINGNLTYSKDFSNNKIHNYNYDKFDNLTEYVCKNGNDIETNIQNVYDDNHSKIVKSIVKNNDSNVLNYVYNYSNSPESKLMGITLTEETEILPKNIFEQNIKYDKLSRIKSINLSPITKEFSYKKVGNHTSNLISKINFATNNKISDHLTYKYDEKGNIVEIRQQNKLMARYFYDALSRLTREDNKEFNTTTTFDYDAGGNIICKKIYDFTLVQNLDFEEEKQIIPYTYPIYGWRDQLTEFNGEKCVYDSLGNPTTYRNKKLKWSHGRQLDKFGLGVDTNNNETCIESYTYNSNGIRTSKVYYPQSLNSPNSSSTESFTTTFTLNGTKILKQHDSCNDLTFYYGVNGVTGFHIKNNAVDADYFYKKNAQNDIIGIYDTNGTQICEYIYDAWGNENCRYLSNNGNYIEIEENYEYNDTSNLNRFVAFKNPFRYRSYYYDFETGLYYLNSRYYDPKVGRFINADDISAIDVTKIALNGLNLYAYCLNNPVNEHDDSGYFLFWLFFTAILIGSIVGGVSNGVKAYKEGARGWGLFGAIAGGAIMGGAMGAITTLGGILGLASIGAISIGITLEIGVGISIGLGIGAGLISYSLENILRDDRDFTFEGLISAGVSGGLKGISTFGVAYYGGKFGAFDKIFLKPILGNELVKDVFSYGLAKSILSAIKPSVGRTIFTYVGLYLGEFLTKLLLVNSVSAGIRWIIDKIFKK